MKISEVIKELNNALTKYGDIPVTMKISGRGKATEIEDIRANEKSVALYNW